MIVDGDLADAKNDATAADKDRKALLAIRKLRRELEWLEYKQREPIAIVGLSCRVPGARDADEFWALLDGGVDAISDVPPERWDIDEYYDPDPDAPGKVYARRAGYVDGVADFDAAFFGISPGEAEFMDPQQRLLLEHAWCALEHAGIAPRTLYGTRTGVFVGVTASDYAMLIQDAGIEPGPYYITGNTLNVAAGRLAYVLRLQGPALAIDTACSSSLVAVHQACASLRSGESDVALAGGVNLLLSPRSTIATCRAHMLSADGRCKAFDSRADGFVRGEGCGIVVLKRQSDAERDRDRILALIVGSAVNQDGRSSGLTVPNGPAQVRVIADALARAQVAPADVSYLEAHGTGTSLGDPIEVQAAARALGAARTARNALLLGSAKTNIGHLEAAAGIAGLIKVVLSLEHERLPRHLHFHEPNPHIPWDELPVEVLAQAREWPRGERARIAGVSSFGFSGTNAHVVVREAPAVSAANDAATASAERRHWLLVLSARTAPALRQSAADYRSWLERHDNACLADVCYTANTGRNRFEHRGVLVFTSAQRLREQLTALATDGAADGLYVGGGRRGLAKPKVGVLFTGQGAQYSGMGRGLYETEPVYREHFDRCATELARLRRGEPDLRDVVFGEADAALLDQTAYTQPALYALEASLVALWRSWGVEPDIVLGHSVGEYAASFAAGVFDLEAGLRLIAERSRLMQALPSGGAMAAIQGKRELIEARAAETEGVAVGAFNGANVVISGPEPAVCAVTERLTTDGCRCTRLKTSHAFHSALMDPMLEPFRAFADGIDYRPPRIKLVSNVTGRVLEAGMIPNASYWTRHVRAPVRFAEGIDALRALGCGVVLEVGPHPVLTTMGQQCWSASEVSGNDAAEPAWVGSLRREHEDHAEMLGAAAALVVAGVELDFTAMEGEALERRRRVALPTYPFQRQRHWLDAAFGERRRRPALDRLFYELRWRAAEPAAVASSRFAGRTWLILGPVAGLGEALRRRLEAVGARVVLADCVDDPAAIPGRVAASIEEAAGEDGRPLAGVVHLWAADGEEPREFAQLEAAQERGVLSALAVAHRLLAQQNEAALWLITRGVHRIVDGDSVSATQAPLWGFGRSVGLGHPRIWGGLVDLPMVGDAEALADQMVQALGAQDGEDHVALRDGRRWVARLEPASGPRWHGKLSLDAARTYLITGGLGAIGLQVAARLVERGARHLVLTARRPPGAAANEVVRQLRNKGCEVTTYQVDIGREADVSRLFDAIEGSRLPAVAGIFHFAGVTRIRSLEQVSHDDFVDVMAAKVWGGWLLDREVRARGIELSLFVCASSTASAWGAPHQADYAAANAYLDALMARREAEGLPACAIQFGPWRGAGMTVDQDALDQLQRMGFRLFQPSIALDAMEAIVVSGAAQMAAVDVDWSTLKPLLEVQKSWPLLESVGEAQRADAAANSDVAHSEELDRLKSASRRERAQILAMTIRTEAARVLGVGPQSIADDASLLELGLDSLMAVDLIGRLRQRLKTIRFSPQLVYGHPTVAALATTLADQIAPGETGCADTESPPGDGTDPRPSPPSTAHRPIGLEGVQYRVNDGPVYTYRRYREQDRAAAILSYANSFGQKTANVLDSVFEWKYLESPQAADRGPVVHVLECDAEVVGFSGTVPARFKIEDDTMPGVWSTDTNVAPSHRTATGWFLHQVDANTPDITLGIPNAAMYPIASATEAVIDLDRYENLKACLDLGGVLASRGVNALLASVSGLGFWPVPRAFDLYAGLRAQTGITVVQVPRFDETFDALWQVVSRDYPGIMVRDQSFLSWRFDRCPIRDYTRYLARRNGAAVGYMVTREIRWRGTRRGRIVDYLVGRDDSAVFDALLRKVMSDFRSRRVVSVTCAVSSSQTQHIRKLRQHGFLHAEPGARVVASRVSHGEKLAAIKNWFFTSADADADYNEDESET